MLDDEDLEVDSPSGEEESEEEPQPEPFYDPLIEPWNDPASTSVLEYRLSRRSAELTAARPVVGPRSADPQAEELSELRRRLRAETVVIPEKRRMWSVTVREVAETLLLALLIFLAVRTSMQNFRVEGASMEPSLQDGEYLIVNKLAYAQLDLDLIDWLPFFSAGDDSVHHLWSSPGRGDVVVFRSPTNVNRDFIKRIIGVHGDVVEIDPAGGGVIVNGQKIEERYVRGDTRCSSSCGPWVVPEDAYFVMGDNRQNSSDSRQGWFVPEENIIGKALITYWHDNSPNLGLAPNHDVSLAEEAAAEE